MGALGCFALNGHGSGRVGIRGDDIDAPGVAQRDGRDEATAGQFGGDEILACYTGKERSGGHLRSDPSDRFNPYRRYQVEQVGT